MSDLVVFDIGMHNGDDAAYYLHLGYRVVGVEANPLLADKCRERFKSQPAVTVVNAGILKQPGQFPFYRSLRDDGWSTFDPEQKRLRDSEWEELIIPCLTTAQLIAQHGKPFFMKVDIEGADLETLESITAVDAPQYVSLELSYTRPILERLIAIGYDSFKFVNGCTYRPNPEIFDHELGWRLLRKAGRTIPAIKHAIRQLPHSMRAKSEYDPPGKYSPTGYEFGEYSSGPFGEQAAGEWLPVAKAIDWLAGLKANYSRHRMEASLWWDVHARHGSVKQ